MGHIERVEAMMEAMTREPDRVFHEVYLILILHDCPSVAAMTGAQHGALLDAVMMACTTILCPPVTVIVLGDEVYLLVQMNPNRSVQDTADAAGSPLPDWPGDYSCVSIGTDNVPQIIAAINDGSIIALLSSRYGEE
ncbi:MAG: hypothetical protein JO250_12275 [Armatimonadetes bacterium]|nr:hypothetical protein [Armatimonadota bacterium]